MVTGDPTASSVRTSMADRRDEGAKRRAKLERLVWKHTHSDFRGKHADGTKHVLHNQEGVTYGTESWPLSKFTEEQLLNKIPRKVREAEGLTAPEASK